MPKITEGVKQLVLEVLQSIPKPYGEDIIEDVLLEIEKNPDWFSRYKQLNDELKKDVVNNWIGKYTKETTGFVSVRIKAADRSRLIHSYTKLVLP
mgnify:CR=1 FL=1